MAEYKNLYKWLREGANIKANVDGSSVAKVYKYTVGAGDTLELERMIVFIKDTGTFDADLYGNGAVLTNGILVKVVYADGSDDLDLLDGLPIKTNGEWQGLCHDFNHNKIGTGDEVASVRWTFAKSGAPLVLETGDSFQVTIQDNLTVLTDHRFQIQGILT